MKKYLILIGIYFATLGNAQSFVLANISPVGVEALIGTRGPTVTMGFEKSLRGLPKIGFMGSAEVLAHWGSSHVDDFSQQTYISYNPIKGFTLYGGYHYTPFDGIKGSFAMKYLYTYKDITFVVNPRFDIKKEGSAEVFSLLLYTPKINEKWSVYSDVFGLYNVNTRDFIHGRSFIRTRVGLRYKDLVRFGLGANFDFYGANRHEINSYGIFIGANIF